MAESSPNRSKTLGKEEIARYNQFLLFPQCFKRLILQTHKNQGLFWKGLRRITGIRDLTMQTDITE